MRRVKFVACLLGVAALAALTVHAGMAAVLRSLATLRLQGFAAVVLIHLPVVALLGLAWWTIGRAGEGEARLFITARWVRDSIAETLPFSQLGGFLGGLRLIRLSGTDIRRGAFSMLADLIVEFAGKLLYAPAGVLALAILVPGAWLIRPMAAVLLLALAATAAAYAYRARIAAILGGWAARMIRRWSPSRASKSGQGLTRFLVPHRALPGFALHAAGWLFGAVEAWVTLRLMGLAVSGGEALAIDSVATALRTFGFLVPAAIGVQEAAYVVACGAFGIAPAEAVAFSFSRRARDIAIGLPGLATWQMLEARACRTPHKLRPRATKGGFSKPGLP
jgi:putative membrane protein